MKAKTVGFAIAEDDRELLDRLSQYYGNGNRSEFLRVAMRRMEHDRLSSKFRETREAIDAELGGRTYSEAEVTELVKKLAVD